MKPILYILLFFALFRLGEMWGAHLQRVAFDKMSSSELIKRAETKAIQEFREMEIKNREKGR